MSVNLVSTTDSPETVTAAMGDLVSKESVEKSAPAKAEKAAADETAEASETSEDVEELESAEDDESESEESEESDSEAQKPKKSNGFKRRIDKLNRRFADKEREAEYWRNEAMKSRPQENKPVEGQRSEPKDVNAKPKVEDFETHSEYVEALTDWKVEQKELQRQAKQREEAAKADFQTKVKSHVERLKAFQDEHDDFEDVVNSVSDIEMSMAVRESILESDLGPNLMYELSKNREELERICKLPAIRAAKEIGKIEDRIQARIAKAPDDDQVEEKKITKAPKPPSPVQKMSTSTRKSIYDVNLSQAEYERLRAEQDKRSRRDEW